MRMSGSSLRNIFVDGWEIRFSGIWFPSTDSGLDMPRSLLHFWFPVSVCALVQLLGSSPDSGSGFPVSDSSLQLLRSLLSFRSPVRARISSVRFAAGLWCDRPAPAQVPFSSVWSQIPVWTCSARFSIFSSEHGPGSKACFRFGCERGRGSNALMLNVLGKVVVSNHSLHTLVLKSIVFHWL